MNNDIVLQDMTKYVVENRTHPMGEGQQIIIRFPNDYGASVVRTPFSYGGSEGKIELAVIQWHSINVNDWTLCYNTPITDDVLGFLSASEVLDVLYTICALPKFT